MLSVRVNEYSTQSFFPSFNSNACSPNKASFASSLSTPIIRSFPSESSNGRSPKAIAVLERIKKSLERYLCSSKKSY